MSMAAASVKKSDGLPKNRDPLKGSGLIRMKDAAAYLGLSTKALWDLVDAKALCAIDVSGGRNPTGRRTLRIAPEEMRRFLRVNATQPLNDT